MDFFRRHSGSATTRVSIQKEGNRQIRQISEAVTTVPWGISLFSLAWTAGPVTLFAAQISYLLGYNKAPTQENLVFFFVYTVITGVAGIVAQLTYKLTQVPKIEQQKKQISLVLEQLPELRWQTLDLATHPLSAEQRARYVARILLQKVDLDPESLKQAVFDLTGNKAFARLLSQIEIYRQVGMDRRIDDLTDNQRFLIRHVMIELEHIEPDAIPILRTRLQGDSPDLKSGMPRQENFIERIFAAIEEENDLLMTHEDVEEMIVLAFELLCGRKIPMLVFDYKGRWELANALDNMETVRSEYRIAQARGLSRIRALASYINKQKTERKEPDAKSIELLQLNQSADLLVELAEEFIDEKAADLREYCIRTRKQRKKPDSLWVHQQADILSDAISLWKEIRRAYEQIGRKHAQLLKTSDRWEKFISRFSVQEEKLQINSGQRGLRVKEKEISLDDKDKADVCEKLYRFLVDNKLTTEDQSKARQKSLRGRVASSELPDDHITPEMAKQLAIEIALALEPHIHLSRPEIQRAIYSTYATYMNDIEPGMSAATKAAMGAAMAVEKRHDFSGAAERLALALVKHYRVELSEEAIAFLRDNYHARESRLNLINQYSSNRERNVSYLNLRPPVVVAPKREWYLALIEARRTVL
ncbi:hypothetical protein [Oceanospirillum sediminis]|uniref:Uncharacterized protein n=1 Tax=Oceanospirillum sediminis TaxID=2760088 RepID=A0A839IST7_9GAMM|nr:hypothetical protein [Oceanospirillum sediminis]MBB1488513.1 hypothetical protein [Oceanospirillum sediminis]